MIFINLNMIIIFITCLVFFYQVLFNSELIYLGAIIGSATFSEPWRLITHMFLHSDFNHLFFNMFALFFFGGLLERRIGSRNFAIVYFLGGLIAAIGGAFVYNLAIGASAAVMAVIGATIIFFPNKEVLLFFFPFRLWQVGFIYVAFDLIGAFGVNNVANFAHLLGFFYGIAFGYFYLKYVGVVHKKIEKEFEVMEYSEYKKKH